MIRNNNKLEYILPVVIWLEVIFFLSSLPGPMLPEMPSDGWRFWAHRIAHFTEYSVLGFLMTRACARVCRSMGLREVALLSVMVLGSGAFDEWHQSFVPGRSPDLLDVCFDTICGMGGVLVYKIFVRASADGDHG